MLSNIENTKNYLYTRLKKIILFLNWDDEFEFGHFIWRYKEELFFFFLRKKYVYLIVFLGEFQYMTSASDDSSLSLDQDTNQFLISVGRD